MNPKTAVIPTRHGVIVIEQKADNSIRISPASAFASLVEACYKNDATMPFQLGDKVRFKPAPGERGD